MIGRTASSRACTGEAFAVASRDNDYDVVVIGGGEAGLAIGYHLAREGRDHRRRDRGRSGLQLAVPRSWLR